MFSIKYKLFLLNLIGFVALIAAIVWQIDREAENVANKSVEKSLASTSKIISENIQNRYKNISEIAVSLTKDGRILPLIFDSDTVTLQDLSYEFHLALDFNILFFTDGYGTILARSDKPEAAGYSMAGRPVFDEALEGETSQGILASRNNIYQLVVSPVLDNFARDIVRGTVALAYEISAEVVSEIQKITQSEVVIYTFARDKDRSITGVNPLHSTDEMVGSQVTGFFTENMGALDSLIDTKQSSLRFDIEGNKDIFHTTITPLYNNRGDILGFISASLSRNALLAPYQKLQRLVIGVGVVSLIVASIIAWLIAARISDPLRDLVSVTEGIENGNYGDGSESDYSSSNDEVGVLYNAILRMGKNLKDKDNLENYLSSLGEGLDAHQESIQMDSFSFPADDSDEITGHLIATQVFQAKIDQSDDKTVKNLSGTPAESDTPSEKHIKKISRLDNVDELGNVIIADRYKVLDLLGVGAMGYVYLAQDMDLDEKIAIKVLKQKEFSDTELKSFKEEIRLARKITHRNILRTFDFGVWNGIYYITMEYVQGFDLETLIKKNGPLEPDIGLVMLKQICSAIDAAHHQGIIHRDLKPGNMLINRQGVLKIMDFGLAMQIENAAAAKTIEGEQILVSGTPKYMAPEQFMAKELDERTDIYAVGVIIHYILSGKTPFNANDYKALGYKHIKDSPPPLHRRAAAVSEALSKIVDKTLEKKKENRYASIKDLLDAIQKL